MTRALPLVVATLLATLLAGCATARPVATTPSTPADSVLFALVVEALTVSRGAPLRVDARPLRPDPALVTLHAVGDVIPERVSGPATRQPFADTLAADLPARRRVLHRLSIAPTDGVADTACPGVMVPLPAGAPLPRRGCPDATYRSVLVALPRAGAAWWPGNLDERAAYRERPVYSVRVIERLVSPGGMAESSADFVFECPARGGCRLLVVRPLLIIE